jgi:nitrous oxidase accessory protein
MNRLLFLFLLHYAAILEGKVWHVGKHRDVETIREAIQRAKAFDTLLIYKGFYREGNLIIDKPLTLEGVGMPVVDGHRKYEVFSVKSDSVIIRKLRIQHSGFASLDDPGGIKVYNSKHVLIEHNELFDNFFGIYLQYCKHCRIQFNRVVAFGKKEDQIGNGIHCWKSDSLLIIGNTLSGNRDGIYFEFVSGSLIWRNIAHSNVRYGLHFMFSNNDTYITNTFRDNGAGVAVMFSHHVDMINNKFDQNWGDAAYGLLLKEISDGRIQGNRFESNTIGAFMDGSNRLKMELNFFSRNGWGIRVQANCMDNLLHKNNFIGNTFDVATNGSLTLNKLEHNYWDKYEGYDLNKDGFGDVPHHPLSLFSLIAEKNNAAMMLYRSLMVTLLDRSERIFPGLTPASFRDDIPVMKAYPL